MKKLAGFLLLVFMIGFSLAGPTSVASVDFSFPSGFFEKTVNPFVFWGIGVIAALVAMGLARISRKKTKVSVRKKRSGKRKK